MDKLEYREKLEELTSYVNDRDYEKALPIVESIDWKRVKSVKTLSMVADVYDAVKQYEDAQRILKLALSRSTIGRNVLSRLVENSLKLNNVEEAEDYFDRFVKAAGDDNVRYLLQYKIFKAKKAPLKAQIAVLEEYRDKEYTEKWAYELATLYDLDGDRDKCVAACDDLILWFGEGKYVLKAMDLKLKYQPLSSEQKKAYANVRSGGTKDAGSESGKESGKKAEKRKEKETAGAESKAKETEESISEASRGEANRTVNKDNLKKSIRTIFQGIREDTLYKEKDSETARLDNTVPLDMLNISELEPETADETVISVTGNPETIVSMPKQENIKRAETSSKVRDFDLNALLEETAGSLSEAVTSGDFSQNNTVQGVSEKAEPTAEEVEEFREAIKTVAGEDFIEEPEQTEPEQDIPEVEEDTESIRQEKARRRSMDDRIAAILSSIEEPEKPSKKIDEAEFGQEAQEAGESGKTDGVSGDNESAGWNNVSGAAEKNAEKRGTDSEKKTGPAGGAHSDTDSMDEADVKTAGTGTAASSSEKNSGAGDGSDKPRKPVYNEELEIPDLEETPKQKLAGSRTINLDKVGQNTVPISLDELLKAETPEERRIRILNKALPTRMNDEQRKTFTYFARIPGMDSQILEAINSVYAHAGEHTSKHGNIGVMGARGTGKSKLTENLVITMCRDLQMPSAKIARINGENMNRKDPADVVKKMSGGFLMIEDCSRMTEDTVNRLSQAMEFRTDCMILILEDEKAAMRAFLKQYPDFAKKIDTVINIPVFTNDELVTFARTYATENDCDIDDMGVLALYTIIGDKQSFEEPMTIAKVKTIMDGAIASAKSNTGRRFGRRKRKMTNGLTTIQEKDFEGN